MGGSVNLHEAFEEAFLIFVGDSNSGINDFKSNKTVRSRRCSKCHAPAAREFKGVVQQIPKDVSQVVLIANDGGRQGRVHLQAPGDALRDALGSDKCAELLKEIPQVERRFLRSFRASL
jgi:hypothetical protein